MKKQIFFVILLIIASYVVKSQDFSISNADAAAYPKIKANINYTGKGEAKQSDFKVYENNKEVTFTFNKDVSKTSGEKAICFLIEASGFTYGGAAENFKKAVINALDKVDATTKINVCYFGKANADGKSLNVLSAEFTTAKTLLQDEIKNKIYARKDTNYIADVFKSIYECLDFVNTKKDLPSDKRIIVISAAVNNSSSPIKAEDCIEKSTKLSIPIYTITYKTGNRYAADNFVKISDKTNGLSKSAKNSTEITSAIDNFITSSTTTEKTANIYTIEFTSTAGTGTFNVEYKGSKLSSTYTIPEGQEGFFKKYWLYLLIGLVVIIAVVVLILLMSNSNKKKKAIEEVKLKDIESKNAQLQNQLSQKTKTPTSIPQEQQKHDLKKTIIAGGGGTPTLMISAPNFSKNFPLNKPKITIGRNQDNDICIPETTVSGSHCFVYFDNGNWFIADNNSTNGVNVNGNKVDKSILKNGDIIRLGAANLKIQF